MTKEVKVTKIVDPIVQSLLLVYFCYKLDGGNYQMALLFIIGWQLLSAVANSFFVFSRKRTTERIINFILIVAFIVSYFIMRKIKENYFEVIAGDGPVQVPVHGTILTVAGIILAFWYYMICFREVRSILKRKKYKKKQH